MSQTVQQLLQAARQQLAQLVPSSEASIEAQILLMQILDVNRAWLLAHATDVVPDQPVQDYTHLVQRRLLGEPIAYILGYREFFGLKLKVTADTLIPRPDTETLVEAALQKITQPWQILDLGTGTGAIALALARHAPLSHVTAVDASEAALKVAETNRQNLQLENISLLHSHWFSQLADQRFDLIVSNPPYIEAADQHLSQGDLRFEPLSALAAGEDGLADIRQIIAQAPDYLNDGGWLLLEHGYNQGEAVQDLYQLAGFRHIQTLRDLGDNPRVTLAQWP
ncbi:MAG: peptide chain release factor N(5)-glutamine methyltransferase [Methylophilus sp.]|uniref:peptide chain release factor N(5)-glutamine methyltransferase n=1 Tax=Methylophilus sp. TaxID=29541 RepID=UPI003FA0136A